jgi:nucleoside-diphosphate-sugar epimerase
MSVCVIFGGAGFVGTHLTKHLLRNGRFTHVHIADIFPTELEGTPGVTSSITDVRLPIPPDLIDEKPEWIFNLAAVHREPGEPPHTRGEYFATNLAGARNVCRYAETVDCNNVYFTSSISVYGPTDGPTAESSPIQPTTPYGSSKYSAELIHEIWQRQKGGRRLLISRPGVLYGPGDPGNIMRMIKAIKKGYFAFPGSPRIYKSYGYIYGLIDSIDYVMDSSLDYFIYNYVETPTQPLNELVNSIKKFLNTGAIVLPLPLWLLLPVSKLIQRILGYKNPIHPVRVKKAATPTHIIPQALKDRGFEFKYDFMNSLRHWRAENPADFESLLPESLTPESNDIKMVRGRENAENIRILSQSKSAEIEKEEEIAA